MNRGGFKAHYALSATTYRKRFATKAVHPDEAGDAQAPAPVPALAPAPPPRGVTRGLHSA